MSEFKQYRRKSISELVPWEKGMVIDQVSISGADKANGSPKKGDMIARNPKNHNDQWLVAKQYFKDNLEEIQEPKTLDYKGRLLLERDELRKKYDKLVVALDKGKVPESAVVALTAQRKIMYSYLAILDQRIGR
jgi:hypothetical protein